MMDTDMSDASSIQSLAVESRGRTAHVEARAAAASTDRVFERGITLLFGAAILVSSWLLFLVQPMFAKMVLPRLGGTPAVWNTCVVFFQATLLVGYLYSHLTTRWLGVRRQAMMHLGVLLLPIVALPIGVTAGSPPTTGTPLWWLLDVLTMSVGLPFFVVSTTSPLLQRWFSAMPHHAARDPYFLYSSSNFASLLALVSYPAIIEPTLRLAEQSRVWTFAYVLFVALVGACAISLRAWARPDSYADAEPHAGAAEADAEPRATAMVTESAALAPNWRVRLQWLAFSFVPSSLMLGVTTHISTDIAAVPLMWVVPLALYLATFMIVFAKRPFLSMRWLARVLPFLAMATLVSTMIGSNPWYLIPLHLVTFFIAAAVCHFRLAAMRPDAQHLTEFYLWMSLGGVLGGLFNTLAAPLLFTGILEYPLALVAACALRPSPAFRRGSLESLQLLVGLPMMVLGICAVFWAVGLFGALPLPAILSFLMIIWALGLAFSNRPAPIGMVLAAGVILVALIPDGGERHILFAARSFFGVHRVVEDGTFHKLLHGGTVHGLQRRDEMSAGVCEPNSYYHRTGPLGQMFDALGPRVRQIGVIGLGSGGTVCYGQPGQQWTFFEIDPTVERIARDRRLFTHLATTKANVEVQLGDGRLLLAKAAPASFDLLILDAFSSDSIPLHLVTREAIDLAFSRLRSDGVLAFHISNRYLSLAPVLGAIARAEGLDARVNFDKASEAEQEIGKQTSTWFVMTRTRPALGPLAADTRWHAAPDTAAAAWTDDFSNILSAFVWTSTPSTTH
jgi:spermidine synthase